VIGFGDMIQIVPSEDARITRRDEVNELARERLAEDVQLRLRGRVDHGLDVRSAHRAQAVRVTAEGNRLVIDRADQGAVLGAAGDQVEETDQTMASSVDELFEPSSGVPKMQRDATGKERLVFRTISAKEVFAQQKQEQADSTVEQTVTDTVRTGIVHAYEGACKTLARQHPEQ